MRFEMNFNQNVRVRLTEAGKDELHRRRNELNQQIEERGGKSFGRLDIKIDNAGYTRFQFHELMNSFGHMMNFNSAQPFAADIIFEEGKPMFTLFFRSDIPEWEHHNGKAFMVVGEEYKVNLTTLAYEPEYTIRFPDGEEIQVHYEDIHP